MSRVSYLLLVLSLCGCAGGGGGAAGWSADEVARAPADKVVLRHGSAKYKPLRPDYIRQLVTLKEEVERHAGALRTGFVIVADHNPNGMLFHEDGQPVLGVTAGMLELLGEDSDAFAALVGHELAHLYRRHADMRRQRHQEQENTSGLIGFALTVIGIPVGALLADAASAVVERSYDRDDELEADRMGLEYMRRAGFDPEGAVRLYERLATVPDPSTVPFLRTHPPAPERVAALRRLVDDLPSKPVEVKP